jgi:hypothetical protein
MPGPAVIAAAYLGGKAVQGLGKAYQANQQQKAASNTPLLTDNDFSSSYGNYLKQYAATGPFSGSQQANFAREAMGSAAPQFQQATTGIMQRGAASGLEDSAVMGEQIAGVDLAKATSRLNIARRIANKNQELRLGYIDKMGIHGQNVYASALTKHRNKMSTAGSTGAALANTAGSVATEWAMGAVGGTKAAPWKVPGS